MSVCVRWFAQPFEVLIKGFTIREREKLRGKQAFRCEKKAVSRTMEVNVE